MHGSGPFAAPTHAPPRRLPRLRRMNRQAIDWSQLWYPGPKRAFTADEMARAGGNGPSTTLLAVAAVNVALMCLMALQAAPQALTARLTGLLVVLVLLGGAAARWLWWQPWRRPLWWVSVGMAALLVATSLVLRWRMHDLQERLALHWALTLGGFTLLMLLWFLVVWRAQQISARLAELAERERAIEMARRLAAAQVEPHFLFNTLASLQHWVQTQDPRAATLLQALTGYLRATLPMFSRALQPAADELLAVRLYLQVMQPAADAGGKRHRTRHQPATGRRHAAAARAGAGRHRCVRGARQRPGSGNSANTGPNTGPHIQQPRRHRLGQQPRASGADLRPAGAAGHQYPPRRRLPGAAATAPHGVT